MEGKKFSYFVLIENLIVYGLGTLEKDSIDRIIDDLAILHAWPGMLHMFSKYFLIFMFFYN